MLQQSHIYIRLNARISIPIALVTDCTRFLHADESCSPCTFSPLAPCTSLSAGQCFTYRCPGWLHAGIRGGGPPRCVAPLPCPALHYLALLCTALRCAALLCTAFQNGWSESNATNIPCRAMHVPLITELVCAHMRACAFVCEFVCMRVCVHVCEFVSRFASRLSGRRRELLLSALIYCLSSLVTCVAPSLLFLLASRVAYGMAIGLVSVRSSLGASLDAVTFRRRAMPSLHRTHDMVWIPVYRAVYLWLLLPSFPHHMLHLRASFLPMMHASVSSSKAPE